MISARYSFVVPEATMDSAAVSNHRFRVVIGGGLTGTMAVALTTVDSITASLAWFMTDVTSSLGDMNTIEFDTAGLDYVGGDLTISFDFDLGNGNQLPATIQASLYGGAPVIPRFWKDETLSFESL